ncbi:DNA replication/repair protein RecF [Candidatus Gromoviella agglomerans]|uniref:DNA replication/repair protein RecF n=1 Tax=Candidatus Gromoviella agglomerans TaxID=2806609 RepID=UPI001E3797DF|nr:AAA family ATPase [Candidatus Gromoviella agglomerans]UFX98126.1 DNA replication and repair protein RecF [Candidatus Gromoviella agglomerans]
MSIKRLLLTKYRNYCNLDLKFNSLCVLLYGRNGVGKTNILEAISLLSSGNGIRGDDFGNMQNVGFVDFWAIFIDMMCAQDGSIRVGIEKTNSGRKIKINSKIAKTTDCLKIAKIVTFAPGVDRIFTDQISVRRRFFNLLIANFDDEYASNLIAYDKYLKERSKILNLLKDESAESFRKYDNWLDVIEDKMSVLSWSIELCRLTFWNKLNKMQFMNDFPAVTVNLTSNVFDIVRFESKLLDNVGIFDISVDDAVAILKKTLKFNRRLDAIKKKTAFGAHRSDINASAYGTQANLCSTGQQKMIVVSMLFSISRLYISEGKKNIILLLDEIAAHIDAYHLTIIFEEIVKLIQCGVQVFVTATDVALFGDLADYLADDFTMIDVEKYVE